MSDNSRISDISEIVGVKRHKKRADDGARTRYLNLGKVALYQMSYIRKKCCPYEIKIKESG